MKIRTVKINNDGTPLIINASDFRDGSDELWEDKEVTTAPEADLELPGEIAEDSVKNDVVVKHKGGGRWIVMVNDVLVHEGTLSKANAQALADEY